MAHAGSNGDLYSIADAFRSISDGVWVVSPDSTLAYINDAGKLFHERAYGTRAVVGAPVSDLYPPAVRSTWTERYAAAAQGSTIRTTENSSGNPDETVEIILDRGTEATSGFPVVAICRRLRATPPADDADEITESGRGYEAEHVRALHALAADLNQYIDRPQVLYERSLELLKSTVRYDSASVQVRRGDELCIVACSGFPNTEEVTGMRFPFDQKFPNWHVITSRETVNLTDAAAEYPHFRDQADQFKSGDIKAWLGVPLAIRDDVVGMVALDRADAVAFTPEEQQLVATMAGQIAVAIHNAQVYRALRTNEELLAEANRQKEVLLREVHHRSKNNMQMISSLLSLGAAAVSVEEDGDVLDEVRMRIQSLAAIHEELYRSDNLDRVDLADYTRRLTRMIEGSYGRAGITLKVEAGEASATIDVSVPFGLILSELVLNAYKHAFPAGRAGSIEVHVGSEKDTGQLIVKDDGVGLTQEQMSSSGDSLGMQLVTGLVEQIDGELDLSDGPGTTWVVRFPTE